MPGEDWLKEFLVAVIVADLKGQIIYMNEKAAKNLEEEGGTRLLGKNLFDCHKPESQEKIKKIIQEKKANIYTIEKGSIKKLIYQVPYTIQGKVRGVVELSLEIPFNLPHFVRD